MNTQHQLAASQGELKQSFAMLDNTGTRWLPAKGTISSQFYRKSQKSAPESLEEASEIYTTETGE